MWIVVVALHLAANIINALLLSRQDGVKSNFPFWALVFLLSTRPRFSWIILGMLSVTNRPSKTLDQTYGCTNGIITPPRVTTPPPSLAVPSPAVPSPAYFPGLRRLRDSWKEKERQRAEEQLREDRRRLGRVVDFPYSSAAISSLIAELFLILFSTVLFIAIANYEARRSLEENRQFWNKVPERLRLVYNGALFTLVGSLIFLLFTIYALYKVVPAMVLDPEERARRLWEPTRKPGRIASEYFIYGSVNIGLILYWMGLWIFWAGYLRLAQDLYCAPSIFSQGGIWVGLTTVGIILGTGT